MNEKKYSMHSQSIVGIVILLLGVILTLGNFDIIEASSVLRYWPVLLIIFGGVRAVQPGASSGRIFGGVLAVIGVFLLLGKLDIIWFEFWDLWPLLLIAVGASLVLRTSRRSADRKGETTDSVISGAAVLSGIEQRNSSLDFRGGSVSAILGGHVIDLRNADMPEGGEAELEVFAFMGGIELRVPNDWSVVLNGSAFMGGFESRAEGSPYGKKKLVIRGQAILGGVEVKN